MGDSPSVLKSFLERLRGDTLFLVKLECFKFEAYGHPNILSTHPNTIELTKEAVLTRKGDCIVGVKASHGLADLPIELKRILMMDSGRGRLVLTVQGESVVIEGRGSKGLTMLDPGEMVVRRSNFISDRTLMVQADKAAKDLPRRFVDLLKDPRQKIVVKISCWQV